MHFFHSSVDCFHEFIPFSPKVRFFAWSLLACVLVKQVKEAKQMDTV